MYELAKAYVKKTHEQEVKAEIKDVYNQLLHESKRQKINPKQLEEVKKTLEIANKIKVRGMGDSYQMKYLRDNLKEIITKKVFHADEFKEFSDRVAERWKEEQKYLKNEK